MESEGREMDPFTWRERVRWRHVDPAGILHFASIFRFFETAEFEFFRHLGYAPNELHPGLPRVHCGANYFAPARLDDVLDTTVTVDHVGRTSFRLQFATRHGQELVADGSTTIVQADEQTGKTLALTEGLGLASSLRACLTTHADDPGKAQ